MQGIQMRLKEVGAEIKRLRVAQGVVKVGKDDILTCKRKCGYYGLSQVTE